MAEAKKEVEEYSAFLRNQMGDTLSDGVAEVLKTRPLDPIQHLAHFLYRSKKTAPSPSPQAARERRNTMATWTPGYVPPDPKSTKQNQQLTKTLPSESKTLNKGSTNLKTSKSDSKSVTDSGYSIQCVDDGVDFQEHEFYGPAVYVHSTALNVFNVIGDLFDDDLLSTHIVATKLTTK